MRSNVLYDVVSLGELIVDFTHFGISSNGYALYEQNPGGARQMLRCRQRDLAAKLHFSAKLARI